jgi:hypothetical protein
MLRGLGAVGRPAMRIRSNWKNGNEFTSDVRRAKAFPGAQPPADKTSKPDKLIGLALSGGGLRSALFNDGFLQGLSHSGFLRYVDYVCSVSGGGYIAGHLATRSEENSQQGFHDDQRGDGQPRWWLGRSPTTGEVDANRLRGVGRYLASKFALAPSFLWSLLLSVLVYAGLVGVVSTLLALFYRSFDDPMFRLLLRDVLDFKFGGELAIAFYPTLIVLLGWLLFCVFGWFRNSPRQSAINRSGLLLFLSAACISVAVFIGNGKTDVSRDGSASIMLNHYAQWLAFAAAALQLVAFVGRDRLFRSERDEAHYWQKGLQKIATTGVILFACFAMVHWMSREDISGYTSQRSPHLVRGDVADWDLLQRLDRGFEQWKHASPAVATTPNSVVDTDGDTDAHLTQNVDVSVDIARSGINLPDQWHQHQSVHPLIPLTENVWTFRASDPPRPENSPDRPSWTFWRRIGGAIEAYFLTLRTPDESDVEGFAESFDASPAVLDCINDYYLLAHHRWNQQRTFLRDFNQDLEQTRFTDYLRHEATESDIDIDSVDLTALKTDALQPVAGGRHEWPVEDDLSNHSAVAAANRALMSVIFPKVVQSMDVPSTLVVPPYDQAARYRWLLAWWTCMCVGICFSAFRNQSSTIYTYYRDRLSKLFLGADHTAGAVGSRGGSTPLHLLRPTRDGLPHPLFLAARMRPCVVEDSYRIRAEPFVFSPIYCGDRDQETFSTTEVGLPGVGERSLWVGDAVTISGAAVSPLMTDNRSLSIVLSFFGDGLGQWLIHRSSSVDDSGKRSLRATPWLSTVACIGIIGISAVCWYWLGIWFSLCLIAILTLGALFVAERDHSGICQFLVEMFRPKRDDTKPLPVHNGQPTLAQKGAPPTCIGHVADGGFYDYLGASELFRRQCSLIVVSDAGAHLGNDTLGPLAKMCSSAAAEYGVQILDLDHESPIDFGRLEFDRENKSERVVHQPYIVARLRYKDNTEGLLVYCQMAITHSDPIEIQQIRNRFPSFPDEPTTNQFYTDDQVAAYRNLGYHIANRMCSELHRWTPDDLAPDTHTTVSPPLLDVVRRRILTAYRLACYQEHSYKSNDVFSEAVWSTKSYRCPSFERTVDSDLLAPVAHPDARSRTESWLRAYENNADLRAKYRHAVLGDINSIEDDVNSECALIWDEIVARATRGSVAGIDDRELISAHLTAIAVACHEIHEGRPNAIFQVGGRDKLVAMTAELSRVLVRPHEIKTEFHDPEIHTPSDRDSLRSSVKRCIGEILELEKCTFQGSERVTTVSFSQCLVMMWGQLCREYAGDIDPQTLSGFQEVADEIRDEGVELAESRVRIWLERGLRKKNLSHVVNALQKAWCLTYLPKSMILGPAPTESASKEKTLKKKG